MTGPVALTRDFQLKLFLAALSAAVLALVIAGTIVAVSMRRQTDARIEQTLVAEARLAAELLDESQAVPLGARMPAIPICRRWIKRPTGSARSSTRA